MIPCEFICQYTTCRNNEAGHCSMDHPKFCPALNYCGACLNAPCEKKNPLPQVGLQTGGSEKMIYTGIIPETEGKVK